MKQRTSSHLVLIVTVVGTLGTWLYSLDSFAAVTASPRPLAFLMTMLAFNLASAFGVRYGGSKPPDEMLATSEALPMPLAYWPTVASPEPPTIRPNVATPPPPPVATS